MRITDQNPSNVFRRPHFLCFMIYFTLYSRASGQSYGIQDFCFDTFPSESDLIGYIYQAYDASKVMVSRVNDEPDDSIYKVTSHSANVRIQKVFDPEVAALLDDCDLSRFGSDAEDLEEDFVVQANCPDRGDHVVDRTFNSSRISETAVGVPNNPNTSLLGEEQTIDGYKYDNSSEKPRVR